PVEIQGRNIARTFWGKAWCRHLEQFSDYENRLPRGRSYVRNGSVCHLSVEAGRVEAIVAGSGLYRVTIRVAPLPATRWRTIRKRCAGQIGTLLELLQGRLSDQVMAVVTDPAKGLFPRPREIQLHCDCPDWADMCKHVAAVLYGVGARLDERPELLFLLRQVDHQELISADLELPSGNGGSGRSRRLAGQDLSNLFGVEIDDEVVAPKKKSSREKGVEGAGGGRSRGKKTATGPGCSKDDKAGAAEKKKPFTPTGATVARLRRRLDMTRAQFAAHIGVSTQSIANWENRRGRLNLQARTLAALTRAWEQED
ncbi:MAG: helix-turn-helix domain-containing protein, partial [Gammaproteobacteria bacterium]